MKLFINAVCILVLAAGCNYTPERQVASKTQKVSVVDTTSYVNADSILKAQLLNYYTIYNSGDIDSALSLMYPGMFLYLKMEDPEGYEQNLDEIKAGLKLVADDMEQYELEYNTTINTVIKDIVKRVEYKSDKLYVVVSSMESKQGLNEINVGQEIIAISVDNGENWKFMQKDPDLTPEILRMSYPIEVINKLMYK